LLDFGGDGDERCLVPRILSSTHPIITTGSQEITTKGRQIKVTASKIMRAGKSQATVNIFARRLCSTNL
jgi:hypothetical protein